MLKSRVYSQDLVANDLSTDEVTAVHKHLDGVVGLPNCVVWVREYTDGAADSPNNSQTKMFLHTGSSLTGFSEQSLAEVF